jgi:hypothetical protein
MSDTNLVQRVNTAPISDQQHTENNSISSARIELIRPSSRFPGVITGVSQLNGKLVGISDQICITIDQSYLWKAGDYWESLDSLPEIEVLINDIRVKNTKISPTGSLITVFDKAGNIIGTHGFGIEVCFQLNDVPIKRENIMVFSVMDTGNLIFTDSWSFVYGN